MLTIIEKDLDYYLILSWILLLIIGVMSVYSATYQVDIGWSNLARNHLIYSVLGLVIGLSMLFMKPIHYYDLSYVTWIVAFLILVSVEVYGKLGMGAVRWIEIAGVRFQPSEIMKIGLILALSRWISDRINNLSNWTTIIGIIVLCVVPFVFVVIQPDLATSTIYFAPVVVILFLSGWPMYSFLAVSIPAFSLVLSFHKVIWFIFLAISSIFLYLNSKKKWITILIILVSILTGFLSPWIWETKLHEYQKSRIVTFLNPDSDPLGKGYQSIQSKIAVGSGGLSGKGYLQGTQTQLDFLPIQHTDFIYSVIAEEWGFVGATFILFLFTFILFRLWIQGYRSKNKFNRIVLYAIAGLWFYQVFINIAMTLGIVPVAGIPLPFLSYGGSSMITHSILMGIAVSFSSRYRSYS